MSTNTCTYANSVDPDETARYEPSHQDLHCMPFGSRVFDGLPCYQQKEVSKFKSRIVQSRNSEMKGCKKDTNVSLYNFHCQRIKRNLRYQQKKVC